MLSITWNKMYIHRDYFSKNVSNDNFNESSNNLYLALQDLLQEKNNWTDVNSFNPILCTTPSFKTCKSVIENYFKVWKIVQKL